MSFLQRQDLNLIDYLRIILKRRMVVVVTTAIVLALVTIQTYKTPRIFQSSAVVYVEQERPLVDFQTQRYWPSTVKLDTEMEIIRSRDVATDAVLHKLKWAASTDSPHYEAMIRKVQSSISTVPLRGTTLIKITGSSRDPGEARQIANAVAKAYKDVNYNSKVQQSTSAVEILKTEIEKYRGEWDQNERALMEFRKENKVISKGTSNRQSEEILHGGISSLGNARSEYLEKQGAYDALKRWYENFDLSMPPPGIARSEMANKYYQDLIENRLELDKYREIYLEKHPKIQELKMTVASLEAEFKIHLRDLLEQLRHEVDFQRRRVNSMERELQSDSDKAMEQTEKDYALSLLQRKVDTSQQFYSRLLEKMTETQIFSSLIKNNVRITELAADPGPNPTPVTPRWRFNMLIGFALGAILGIAGAFFLEYIDKTFKTPDELEKYLSIPVLGVIPKMTKELYKTAYGPPELLEQGELNT